MAEFSSRGVRWASAAVLSTALLSGCTLTVTGSGTVTVTSDEAATTYDSMSGLGTVAYVCAAGAASCKDTDPYLYSYYPEGGTKDWVVGPGFPVFDPSGRATPLPSGVYALQGTEYRDGPSQRWTNTVAIDVFPTSDMDRTIMHQAYQRENAEASCIAGWQPSWAQWPSEGRGGFVCNRQIYAYHPDLPVQ